MGLLDFLTSLKIALSPGKAQSIKKNYHVTFLSPLLCKISDKSNVGIQCLLCSTVPASMSRKAWPAVSGKAWPVVSGKAWPCLGRRGHVWEGVAVSGKVWPCLGRRGRRNWGQ